MDYDIYPDPPTPRERETARYQRQLQQALDRRDPDSRQAVAHLPVGDNLPRSLGEAIHWKERALKAEADRDEAQSALGYVLAHLKGVIRYVEEK